MSSKFGQLAERAKFVPVVVPQTQNGAAVDGLYTHFKRHSRAVYVVQVGNRAGATTPDITFTQATDNAGTGAKALAFDTSWKTGAVSQAADADALTAVAAASNAVPLPATDNTLVVIEIRGEQLDIANGFTHAKISVATPGANDVPIAILAIMYDGDWSGNPTKLPSVLD